jgi:hypothetical protein
LGREHLLESCTCKGAEFSQIVLRERLALGRALELHVPAIVRHNDVEVHVCVRVERIDEVKGGDAAADADGDGGDRAARCRTAGW